MKRIKHYKIEKLLGSGGMGEVYKAFDSMLERDVAIKIMHRHLLDDEIVDRRFLREARAVAKLVHPNIVTIYEVGKIKSGRYIVMEYVDGAPLTSYLKPDKTLQVESAVRLIIQLLNGLFCAHGMGIMHRDIKPENILVTKNNTAKILDFGIAKIASKEGLTAAGDILGTVEYMAPEQMLGEAIDHRCDIYSAGVVLYQTLTKRLSFTGETPVAILYKILNEDPVPPSYYNSEVSQELDRIVLTAINKAKEERWKTAEEFSKALESILRRESVALHVESGEDSYEFSNLADDLEAVDNNQNAVSLRSVFIGRDKEFKRLVNLFSRATRGEGQTALLIGEAGVGKSTLANRLRNYAEENKALVLYGACLYQEGMDPYLPYIDALRGFFRKDSHTLPEKERSQLKEMIRDKVPILHEFTERFTTNFGPRSATPQDNGNSNTENTFDAIYQLISLLATIKPAILIIDDLHWADEASLRLFHYLSRHVFKDRVLLLGICRTDRYDLQKNGQPTMVVDVLARIRREGTCVQMTLDRLSKEDCDNLIDKTLSPTLFTDEFYELIYTETKGNPLFLLETLKLLRENGTVFFKKGSWTTKQEGLQIAVPHRVEDVFIRRLSVLNDEEREILQFASVVGYEFDASQVSRLLEITKIKMFRSLQRVERDLQIVASTEQGFKFEHPMLRDLLYKELPKGLCREYHLMVAADLERVHNGNYGALIGEMALHLRRGGDHAKAAPLLYQAAERSYKLAAYRETSLFIEDFLDSVKQSGQHEIEVRKQQTLYLKLARSYEETGRWQESLDAYQELIQISEKCEDPKGQVEALKRMGRIQAKLGDLETALATYNDCLGLVKENQIREALSGLYNSLGIIHYERGDLDQAQQCFKETIKVSDSENNAPFKANVFANLGIISNIRGDYADALKNHEKALEIYQQEGEEKNIARVYHNIGLTYMDMGEWSKSTEAFNHCLKLIDGVEDKQLKGLIHLNLGKVHAQQGDISQAKKNAEKALKMFKIMGDILSVAEAYHVFGMIHAANGNFSEAELFLNESIQINEQKDYREGLADTFVTYAKLCDKKGDVEQSKRYYEDAAKIFEELDLKNKAEMISNSIHEFKNHEN